jgi:hypothetical protein
MPLRLALGKLSLNRQVSYGCGGKGEREGGKSLSDDNGEGETSKRRFLISFHQISFRRAIPPWESTPRNA